MSRKTRIRIEVSVLAGLLALAGTATAQDPAVVNAKTIQVKLDNDRVRVLEATLEPGAKEQPHSHPAYVVYVLAGGTIRLHGADGKTSDLTFKTGDVLYREPVAQHWGENVGTTTTHLILVELKNPH